MRPRLVRRCLLPLAVLALSSSLALAQPPAPPAPAQQAAPIERQPPSYGPGRPGMMHGGPGNFRGGGMMHGRGRGPVGGFHGGPGAGFRGAQDGLGAGFHIAPLGMWWKNPAIVQRLTLTADQVKRMDDIFQQSRIQLIDLKANVEKQEVTLEPMLSANPPDTAKAMAEIDKVAQARADLEKANARMLLGIRGVLTPDQWTKLNVTSGFGGGAPAPGQPGPAAQSGGAGGPGRGRGRGYGAGTGSGNFAAPAGVNMDDTRP